MRILVLGAGAVGGYFGSKLVEAGCDVTFCARGEHARALGDGGLRLVGAEQETLAVSVLDPKGRPIPFDTVVLATKCQDLRKAMGDIRAWISEKTTLLALQNGIDAEEICREFAAAGQILAGVAYVDAQIVGPGKIHIGSPGKIALGAWAREATGRVGPVREIFEKAGISARIPADIVTAKWNKLSWNAVFNPLCLLTRGTVRKVRDDPRLKETGASILAEIRAVGARFDVRIDERFAERFFGPLDPQGSGNLETRTSMWSDYIRGRPTEIDYLNGAIVRRGLRTGVPTPVNSAVVSLVHALEASRPGA